MERDLVIGIDSSTSATKATVWDSSGCLQCEGRESIPMSTPQPGHFEQDPNDWWGSTVTALRSVTEQIDSSRVAAVSISNQRETFGLFNKDGSPSRPATVWLDERALSEADFLADKVGRDRIREICGKPADVLVPINRMVWFKNNESEMFGGVHKYSDVHGYLSYRLSDKWTTSTASADPSGMLDVQSKDWSSELLSAADIPEHYLPSLALPGDVIGEVTSVASSETGLREGTLLVAGGGDGQCAATGAGAIEESYGYINLGTAVVTGVYSPTYGHDQAFRTESAVLDDGYIFETVLKSGTYLVDWFAREIGGATPDNISKILRILESESSSSPVGSGGVIALPFWQGSMTPHWDALARGVMVGLSGETSRGDMYRAVLEGIALDQACALRKALSIVDVSLSRLVAIGGGSASSLFLQIIADSFNVPVSRASVPEASALGAAMCAAKGAGWFGSIREACRSMSQDDLTTTDPIPENVSRYLELSDIYDDLWPTLRSWNERLRAFGSPR